MIPSTTRRDLRRYPCLCLSPSPSARLSLPEPVCPLPCSSPLCARLPSAQLPVIRPSALCPSALCPIALPQGLERGRGCDHRESEKLTFLIRRWRKIIIWKNKGGATGNRTLVSQNECVHCLISFHCINGMKLCVFLYFCTVYFQSRYKLKYILVWGNLPPIKKYESESCFCSGITPWSPRLSGILKIPSSTPPCPRVEPKPGVKREEMESLILILRQSSLSTKKHSFFDFPQLFFNLVREFFTDILYPSLALIFR